jgi:hypothetical protein
LVGGVVTDRIIAITDVSPGARFFCDGDAMVPYREHKGVCDALEEWKARALKAEQTPEINKETAEKAKKHDAALELLRSRDGDCARDLRVGIERCHGGLDHWKKRALAAEKAEEKAALHDDALTVLFHKPHGDVTLRQAIGELIVKWSEAEASLHNERETVRCLRSGVAEMEKANAGFVSGLRREKENGDALQQKAAGLAAELTRVRGAHQADRLSFRDRADAENNLIDGLRSELQAERTNVNKLSNALSDKVAAYLRVEEARNGYRADNARLQQKLATMEAQITAYGQLKEERDALQERLTTLTGYYDARGEGMRQLTGERDEARKEAAAWKCSYEELMLTTVHRDNYYAAEQARNNAIAASNEARQHLADMQIDYDQQTARYGVLANELREKDAAYKRLEEADDRLIAESHKLAAERDKWKESWRLAEELRASDRLGFANRIDDENKDHAALIEKNNGLTAELTKWRDSSNALAKENDRLRLRADDAERWLKTHGKDSLPEQVAEAVVTRLQETPEGPDLTCDFGPLVERLGNALAPEFVALASKVAAELAKLRDALDRHESRVSEGGPIHAPTQFVPCATARPVDAKWFGDVQRDIASQLDCAARANDIPKDGSNGLYAANQWSSVARGADKPDSYTPDWTPGGSLQPTIPQLIAYWKRSIAEYDRADPARSSHRDGMRYQMAECVAQLESARPYAEPRTLYTGKVDPDAPKDEYDLPDFWDARRRREGRPDASRCADELRVALSQIRPRQS